jgi:hypothetical protein
VRRCRMAVCAAIAYGSTEPVARIAARLFGARVREPGVRYPTILSPPRVHQQLTSSALMENWGYVRVRMVREPTQRLTKE